MLVNLFYKESRSKTKKSNFRERVGGEGGGSFSEFVFPKNVKKKFLGRGSRVSEIFFTKNPNLKKKRKKRRKMLFFFLIFFSLWGWGEGRGGLAKVCLDKESKSKKKKQIFFSFLSFFLFFFFFLVWRGWGEGGRLSVFF